MLTFFEREVCEGIFCTIPYFAFYYGVFYSKRFMSEDIYLILAGSSRIRSGPVFFGYMRYTYENKWKMDILLNDIFCYLRKFLTRHS